MQNDTFKRFSRDLHGALVVPANYLSKKNKKPPLHEKKRSAGQSDFSIADKTHYHHHRENNSYLNIERNSHFHSPALSTASLASDSVSVHNFSLSTISKTSDDNQSFTSLNGSCAGTLGMGYPHNPLPLPPFQPHQQQGQSQSLQRPLSLSIKTRKMGLGSLVRSPLSPTGATLKYGRLFPNESPTCPQEQQPAMVHCPPSVSSIDQLSPERRQWVRDCLQPMNDSMAASNTQSRTFGQESLHMSGSIIKSGRAWDTVGRHEQGRHQSMDDERVPAGVILNRQSFTKSGYRNTNEPTGLVLAKLMQVSNKATSKVFDIECSLRVGNVERTSYPSRSFKDSPGNTATMNEIFLFDINEPSHLEVEVTGTPVATKFGTMAGFTNSQVVHLGYINIPLSLKSTGKAVRTYKLHRRIPLGDGTYPSATAASSGFNLHTGLQFHGNNTSTSSIAKAIAKEKVDCEIVLMIGIHALEEPIEDRSWETEIIYQGDLTFMTRGVTRMASWKRYWTVLRGNSIKVYDAEYQLRRDAVAIIPLASVVNVHPPDYDKVDIGANVLAIAVDSTFVNMDPRQGLAKGQPVPSEEDVDLSDMDFKIYAFADSAYLHGVWKASLEEGLEQYRENMGLRREVLAARQYRLQKMKQGLQLQQQLKQQQLRSRSRSCLYDTGCLDEDGEERQGQRRKVKNAATRVEGGNGEDAEPLDLIDLKFVS
ncbi:hypothetical protein BGW38_008833 [Lunasporangiospora selenospora]|uniref:PH domain-containing protein n=1 Tax=Lunasporangiospora selenospora TaxID=979761 RepID=A0A9P6FYW1_9FUNG|nr:hypothetical protein BGW38_008833 [Lunasporangiospora selenospora]